MPLFFLLKQIFSAKSLRFSFLRKLALPVKKKKFIIGFGTPHRCSDKPSLCQLAQDLRQKRKKKKTKNSHEARANFRTGDGIRDTDCCPLCLGSLRKKARCFGGRPLRVSGRFERHSESDISTRPIGRGEVSFVFGSQPRGVNGARGTSMLVEAAETMSLVRALLLLLCASRHSVMCSPVGKVSPFSRALRLFARVSFFFILEFKTNLCSYLLKLPIHY